MPMGATDPCKIGVMGSTPFRPGIPGSNPGWVNVYGRATRLATGTGWKPVEHESALRVRLPLLPLWPGPVLVSGDRL